MDNNIVDIKKQHFEIQKAIRFMVDKFLKTDGTQKELHTEKPVVIHSLKTGFILFDFGYEKDLVIAGFLHDVMEDAEVTYKEIENNFNKRVADIVQAVSVDRAIIDGVERHKDLYEREITAGRDAIIVAIADHLENMPFLKYAKDKEEYETVKARWFVFLNEVAIKVSDEPICKKYLTEMKKIK